MNKKIPELLIIIVLFVSPLTRTMWSGLVLIPIILIAFFLAYPFRVQKIFSLILALIGGGVFSSFFLATYPANSIAIYTATLAVCLAIAVQAIIQQKKNKLIFTIMLLGCFTLYSQWGILQFIVQHDVGMSVIGESILHQNIHGVASFYIGSEKFIRAYGPFSHANIFGGVLLLGIILLYKYQITFKNTFFTQGILFILTLGILVSFSRTALAGLMGIGLFFAYKHKNKLHLLVPILLTAALFIPLISYRSVDSHSTSTSERLIGLGWFENMISIETSIRGLGLGNYPQALMNHLEINAIQHTTWNIAPIHSVPLVLFSELGIIVCTLLIIACIRFRIIQKRLIFIVLIPALLLDHYFVTQLAPFLFLIVSANLVVQ
ncbi:MAG TPA: hypothetical protein VJI96_02600 [Candidatus Andersenbacteria bacterium]|nr:hypothetical protein [Candidatus Andersenbacteria bacterium]